MKTTISNTFATPHLPKLVFQHNNLVRASLKISNIEARIFALSLASLNQDTDSLAIEIAIRDIIVKPPGGGGYKLIREGCQNLTSNLIRVETTGPEGQHTFVNTPLFQELRLEEGSGLLTGAFHEKLRHHLLQPTLEFTKCEVQALLTLKSAPAHRLYWILKSWGKSLGSITLQLDQLRNMLLGQDASSYLIWTDFKRSLLEPARMELENAGWPISYEEKKRGRKVTSITFTIPIQTQAVKSKPAAGATQQLTSAQVEQYPGSLTTKDAPLIYLYQRMRLDFNLSEPQARAICDIVKNVGLV
jgi:plasmid replication initiation protein